MEIISQHPHPNIIQYYGCRVNRGRITGLVLDNHPNNLTDYMKINGSVEKEPFMEALKSAVYHLHSLGCAHNNINPGHILVNKEGMPVLVDFGSARTIGAKLGSGLGTVGWYDGEIQDYSTSDTPNDLSALENISRWLDFPTFDD